ncbi:Acetyl-CoA acetyltransferase [Haladaptatus litoreus]|uniref:Acetyl-CoA acetyltransferase n=1 Tax=Haladaptatus litoreus TaxID=553468 RepID=A0A1N7CNW6_9EURY|nr:Acetyl-CoA acetyltransferase [Haladaptatus litoreus]
MQLRPMKPVLIGYGETSVGESLNCRYEELNMWATREALCDVDLEPDDIDGLIATAPFRTERFPLPRLIEYLGIAPLNFAELTGVGGASHVSSIHRAASAIENGQAETILVVAADALHSDIGPRTVIEELSDSVSEFEEPANIVPSLYAHVANWHLDTFGTTRKQLAEIAAIAHEHASLQRAERAHRQKAKSADEILDAPMVATPLTADQCALISDGGAAFIVTTEENAAELDQVPVRLTGFGARHTHDHISQMPSFNETGAIEAGQRAMAEATVDHADIDVLQIYDCFTITVLRILEDLGFCERGNGGDLVDSGALRLTGKWPLNTHGGALAQAHPGMPCGIFHITEAIRQLQGRAEATQVEDASTALVHGNGGIFSTQAVAILERGECHAD